MWRAAFATDICDDHSAVVANCHLGAMALADAGALDETEGGGQERHRDAHVGVGEDRYDRGRRRRAVDLHGWTSFSRRPVPERPSDLPVMAEGVGHPAQ